MIVWIHHHIGRLAEERIYGLRMHRAIGRGRRRTVAEQLVEEAGGDARCVRVVARDRTVKGEGIFRRETIEIPPEIRARRKQLGIDYGKFDFVIHEGKPYLLDANKTPGRPPSAAIVPILAEGLAGIIKRPR